jgi:hypothetical protein
MGKHGTYAERTSNRYPGVFYSRDKAQRVGVAAYLDHEDLTFSWLLEANPDGAQWLELEMEADEAEQFAHTILNRVAQLKGRGQEVGKA